MTLETAKNSRVLDILLVEDDNADAVLVFEAFKDFKTPVDLIRVKDGEEALAYLKKEGKYDKAHTPDLVLLDLNMPKKGGLEVLREMKNNPKLKEITVVVLTSSQSNKDTEDTYEAKANFYMVKPSDFTGFCDAMKFLEETWLPTIKHHD
jgi:CheY-like chemotaxis protein